MHSRCITMCVTMLVLCVAVVHADIQLGPDTNITIGTRGNLGNSAELTTDLLRRHLLLALGRDQLTGDGPAVRFILEADAERWTELVGQVDRLSEIDAYKVEITDQPPTVRLHGRTAQACSYAVTDFLENNLGVMWFMPGELGLCLPQEKTFKLAPGSRRVEPAVASRVYTGLKMGDPALGRFGYDGLIHNDRYYFKSHDAIKALRLHHLSFASHALVRVFDVNEFGKTDPDIYPLIDGKRYIPPTDRTAFYYQNWHVCFTNPKVVDIAVKKAKAYFAAGNGQTFSLGINDGVNSKCQCAPCTKAGTAQSYFDFVNAVARRVHDEYPLPYMIGVLAYGDVSLPTDGLKLEDNVLVLNGPQYFEGHAKNLAAYEYLYGWGFWVPNFPLQTMKRNAKRYRDFGVMALHAEVHPVWAFDAPKVYIRSKLLWNPDLDVDAAMSRFCHAAFGPGGPAMARFYQRWAELTDAHIPASDPAPMVDIYAFRRSEAQFTRVSESDYQHAAECLAEARAATRDELIHRRLDMIDAFMQYSRTLFDIRQNKQRVFAHAGAMSALHAEATRLGERRYALLQQMRSHDEWFTGTVQDVDRILSSTWEGRWEWTLDYEHDCALRTAAHAIGPPTHIEPKHLGNWDIYHRQYNQDIYTSLIAQTAGNATQFSDEGGSGKRYLRGAFPIEQDKEYLAEFDITAANGELIIKLHNMNVCGKTAVITEKIGPETTSLKRRVVLKPVETWGGISRRVTNLDIEVLWHPYDQKGRLEGTAQFGALVLGAPPAATQPAPAAQPVGDNFDFETGDAGPGTQGKLPPVWDRAVSSLAGVQIVKDARPESSGQQALKLQGSTDVSTTGIISRMQSFDDSRPLNISIWVRDDGDRSDKRKPHIAMAWYDENRKPLIVLPGTKMNYVYVNTRKPGGWQRVQKTFTPSPGGEAFNRYEHIPQGAAFFTLRLNLMQYPGPVLFDDFTFHQNASADAAPKVKSRAITPEPTQWAVAWLGKSGKRDRYGPKKAAAELAHYMSAVLGKPVPVTAWEDAPTDRRIVLVSYAGAIGGAVADDLRGKKHDAFVMRYPFKHGGREVCLLASGDEYACDYPVYQFLRTAMNVHWVGPGELGEVVPSQPDWRIPDRISVLENPDFAMRLWGDQQFKMARPILAGSSRMGFHHALGTIFDPDKHGDTPEVYPLVNGKRYIPTERKSTHRIQSGWQPCIAHPKSIQIATEHVLSALANSHAISASLSVNDGSGNTCECNLCMALSPDLGERFFRFYNLVAERVVAKNPDAYIGVLAYGPCGHPPKQTRIHDRIVVFVTGGDPTRFGDIGGRRAVYFYHLDNAYPTIRHYPNLLAEYVRTVHEHGGIAMYTQIEHNWAAGGPKTYLLAHLLWDIDTDVDATLDRYMRLAFGEHAAGAMRDYYDHWEAIFNRDKRKTYFNTIEGWTSNHLEKHQAVTWDDIAFFDNAMSLAKAASKTKKQTERFAYFHAYYLWARANLAQYLMARDLQDSTWLAGKSSDEVFDTAQRAVALTAEFDERWERDMAPDRSGWMLYGRVHKYVAQGRRYYDSLLVDPIRVAVEGYLGEAMDYALMQVAKQRGASAPAYLKEQAAKRPTLQPFIGPVLDKLTGIERPNALPNASFEEGELVQSAPPKLTGWWFYDRVGMVMGATAEYEWSSEHSRDGGKSLGFGPGKYPGARTFLKLEPGRYRMAFWYRTKNRDKHVTVNLLRMQPKYTEADFKTEARVREISAINDSFLKFLAQHHPPTDDKWVQVVKSVEIKEAGMYCLMLEPFFMPEDGWVWFDDLELRMVWSEAQ